MPRGEARSHRTDLSGPEVETLLLYCEGLTMDAIARRLFRDPHSIYARLYRICDAWGVETPLGLVKAAVERRLVRVGSLPTFGPEGRCPCCRDVMQEEAMQVLASFWEGRGREATAAHLGQTQDWVRARYPWLRERLGCTRSGAHAFVVGALRTGLLHAWMRGVGRELGADRAGAVGDGGWDAQRPAVGRTEIPGRGWMSGEGGAVFAEPAAAVHHDRRLAGAETA